MRRGRGIVGRTRASRVGLGGAALALYVATGCGGAISEDSDLAMAGAPGVGGAFGAVGGSESVASGGGPVGVGGVGVGGSGASGGRSGGAGGTGGEPVGGTGGVLEACVVQGVPGVALRFDRGEALAADGTDASFFHFPWPEISRPFADVLGMPNPSAAQGCSPPAGTGVAALVSAAIEPYDYRQYVIGRSENALGTGARHPVVYLAFSDGLNESNLPSPSQSLDPSAAVFLMDVGPNSLGKPIPIQTRVYHNSHYLPENTLAAAPAAGFPLEANGRYALVVRRSLGDASGNLLGSPAEFEAKKLAVGCAGFDQDYADAFTFLEAELGLGREEVAAMTIFQSGTPTSTFEDFLPSIEETPPGLADVTPSGPADDVGGGLHVLEGTLEALVQQLGTPPYLPAISVSLAGVTVTFSPENSDGAYLDTGPATSPGPGAPGAARTEPVDFVLTLPDSILAGASIENVPLVVYGPGTGGSRYSALDEGIAADLGALGVATVSITPVMHQERAHAENISTSLLNQLAVADSLQGTTYQAQLIQTVESGQLFFNPLNLEAARGNSLQAATDFVWLGQVFSHIVLEANVGGAARSISFDDERIEFFGHSQGASTGGLLAASSQYDSAVLSGVSGYLPVALLHKTKPSDQLGIESMLSYVVCDDASEPLDETHPFLALLGHFLEPADAELYVGKFAQGAYAKNLFVIAGRDDAYAPPPANDAVTTAGGLHEVEAPPGVVPGPVEGQTLLALLHPGAGFGATYATVSENLAGVTGAFRRYHDPSCADDHFVYLCSPPAHEDWQAFFETALTGAPVVPWQP
jgi:hypothetical protein